MVGKAHYSEMNLVKNDLIVPPHIFRASLQSRMADDSPPIYSAGLDLWSSHHSGYMGLNLHYLNPEFERVIFNLSCTPFDTSHTGLNISRKLHSVLEDWEVDKKMTVCLRDNAANMASAFNDVNQDEFAVKLESVGCMTHTLQGTNQSNHLTL